MKHSQLKQLIKEEIQSILKEWGGGLPDDPNSHFGKMNAKRQAQNAEWERRNKLPVSSRKTLEAGDIVGS